MTLAVGDRLAKVTKTEPTTLVENEMAREFEVLYVGGYTDTTLVVLKKVK